MTTNTLTLSDNLTVTLTRDYERSDHFVTLPATGLPETGQAHALADALRAFGLEAMPDQECPWDFAEDGLRVYCAELAA